MKKTLLYLVLITFTLSLILTGCQRRDAGRTQIAEGEITMRLLTDATGIDDKSFNAAAWRGILEFYGDTWQNARNRGRLYDVVTAQTQDMYVPNLMQATDEGYDLIVTTGFTWADALQEVANRSPRQNFMIVDVDWLEGDNIMQAAYAEHEGSFLVGAAAALKALEDGITNPRFGFIGGVPGAVITKFHVGFVQGVLSVIPNADIVDFYVNSWGEPALAKTQAMNWYDAGVYAIFSAAGGSGNGTIAQAKEYREAGRNVWAIGVDSDQHEEGLFNDTDSAVLTSMLKQVETSLVYALNAISDDTFSGRIITFDLAINGVGYAVTNPAMTPGIIDRLEEKKQQIINGEITVASTHAAARQLPGFPQNLRAVDD